jgi:hypothetical protein
MKKYVLITLFIITHPIISCPACVGRLEPDTPPFFSKEYDERYWSDKDEQEKKDEK